MLTPMDIQQKKFHAGLGFEKKDVLAFFREVSTDYEKLFRKNAALTEQVSSLEDRLQNYKSKEKELEKNMMLAEKESVDKKSQANREAKSIEVEAKNKAKNIVSDAENRLIALEDEIAELTTVYAAYKSNFVTLLKKQFAFLEEVDFDGSAYIDDRAWSLIGGAASGGAKQAEDSGDFGSFSGDPQMRDPSMGGIGSGISTYQTGGGGFGDDSKLSTSAVYTAGLSANDNFVDPFSPKKKDDGRYNPYDGSDTKKKQESSKKEPAKENASSKAAAEKAKQVIQNQQKKAASDKAEAEKKAAEKAASEKAAKAAAEKQAAEKRAAEKAQRAAAEKEAAEWAAKKAAEREASEKAAKAAAEAAKAAEEAAIAAAAKLAAERKAVEEEREKAKAAAASASDFAEKAETSFETAEEDESLTGEVEAKPEIALIGDEADKDADDDFEFI